MLFNRSKRICKFGNNTYPRRIRPRSNLGHIFPEKSASYGPGNKVDSKEILVFKSKSLGLVVSLV